MESQFVLAAILVLASGVCAPLPAQLDLTPNEGVYIGEATPFACIRFRDGDKVARFTPPPGWRFTAEGARCAFQPAGSAQASGLISVMKLVTGGDATSPQRLEKLLTEGVPSGASGVTFTLTGLAGVKLDHWDARRTEVAYEHFGQKFKAALLIVPMKTEEMHIRFGCRASDFDRLFTPFFESLGTFTWMSAKEDRATWPAEKSAAK
jgi:hypothetical protein